jgi:hypothetical protein
MVSDECLQADFAAVREFRGPPPKDPAFRSSKPTRRRSPPTLMATLTAIVLFGAIAWTQAANYYIRGSGPVGDGSGSSAANAADASTAAKYAAIISTHNTSGTVISYAAGTYLMSPSFSMFDGVTHQGAGIDQTIIKIVNGAVSLTFAPMFRATGGTITGFQFFDATIDFNTVNQPWWINNTQGQCMAFSFSTATNCTIRRIKFINIGSKNQESFPIYLDGNTASKGAVKNTLIDSCIFTQPVPSGNTGGGLTCIFIADIEPGITVDNTNVVSNCQFLNFAYPTYSDLQYAHACTCPVAINNTCTNLDVLWYIEPGSQSTGSNVFFTGQTCQVTGNTVNGGYVANISMHANGNFAGNLNVQNNTCNLSQSAYRFFGIRYPRCVSFEAYDRTGNPPIGNVTILNNTFTAPSPPWTANPVAVLVNPSSPNLFHLASLTVINNRFVNFPGDGSEIQVNTAQVGTYTNTGNTFGPPLHPLAPNSHTGLPHTHQ